MIDNTEASNSNVQPAEKEGYLASVSDKPDDKPAPMDDDDDMVSDIYVTVLVLLSRFSLSTPYLELSQLNTYVCNSKMSAVCGCSEQQTADFCSTGVLKVYISTITYTHILSYYYTQILFC